MADAGLAGFRCDECGYVWATATEARNVVLLRPKLDRRRESKKAVYAGPSRRKDDRVKN
jgi:hypothetical protein